MSQSAEAARPFASRRQPVRLPPLVRETHKPSAWPVATPRRAWIRVVIARPWTAGSGPHFLREEADHRVRVDVPALVMKAIGERAEEDCQAVPLGVGDE